MQTIDSIIPVMVTSLKSTHSDRLSLCIGAKDLLRIFADAANHVPRHRRTKCVPILDFVTVWLNHYLVSSRT